MRQIPPFSEYGTLIHSSLATKPAGLHSGPASISSNDFALTHQQEHQTPTPVKHNTVYANRQHINSPAHRAPSNSHEL